MQPHQRAFAVITILLLALVVVILNDRLKRRRGRGAEAKSPPARGAGPATPGWFWVFLVVGLAVLIATGRSRPGPGGGAPEGVPPSSWLRLVAAGVGVLLASFVGYFFWQYKVLMKVLGRANAGDTDGVIAEMREAIRTRGPSSDRLNTLGVLLGTKDAWAEADECFREAIRLGGRGLPLGNHGLATWKLGRAEDAAAILQDACIAAPTDLSAACHYCQVLADLGRFEESRRELERAEGLSGGATALMPGQRQVRADLVEQSRRKLEEALGNKGDLRGLDEL